MSCRTRHLFSLASKQVPEGPTNVYYFCIHEESLCIVLFYSFAAHGERALFLLLKDVRRGEGVWVVNMSFLIVLFRDGCLAFHGSWRL